jgi:tetratricopeptide (TPR) repeat protein
MRVNGKWLAALLLLAVLPLSGCGFIKKLQSRDNLNKGVKAFTDQKYSDSVIYFKKAIELDPSMEQPHMYLATAYMLQFVPGSMDPDNAKYAQLAIDTFKSVVDRSEAEGHPNVNAMLAIASLTYQMKNVEQTREWCNRILQLPAATDEEKKNQAEAHYRIAVMLFDNVHERLGIIGEKVADLTPDDKTQIMDYIQEGLDHLEKAIQERPSYYDAMMYQNLLWREQEKLVEDKEAKKELIQKADKAYAKAVKLKLEAEAEAASKFNKLDLGNQ